MSFPFPLHLYAKQLRPPLRSRPSGLHSAPAQHFPSDIKIPPFYPFYLTLHIISLLFSLHATSYPRCSLSSSSHPLHPPVHSNLPCPTIFPPLPTLIIVGGIGRKMPDNMSLPLYEYRCPSQATLHFSMPIKLNFPFDLTPPLSSTFTPPLQFPPFFSILSYSPSTHPLHVTPIQDILWTESHSLKPSKGS